MLTLPAANVVDSSLFHCPGCGLDLPNRSHSRGGLLTEEHIIPQALGNERWSIALCNACNAFFNQKFETIYLNEAGIVRARASVPLNTRRSHLTRWTSVTRVRTRQHEVLIQQRVTPQGIERNDVTLPLGTFERQRMFQELPPGFDQGEVVRSQLDWNWSVRLRCALKIGLEQIFFHLGTSAEGLELISFIRSILFATEDELLLRSETAFDGRVVCAGVEMDTPPVQVGGRAIPHIIRVNHGFEARSLELEARAIDSFWGLGPHMLRTRIRRLNVNLGSRRQSVMHISQEILGVSATVVRLHLTNSDSEHLSQKFMIQDIINTQTGKRRTIER